MVHPSSRLAVLFLLVVAAAAGPAAAETTSPYADIDRHALSVQRASGAPVTDLAVALTAPARTDQEAARAIFRWIAANISYDVPAHRAGDIAEADPEAVLRRGKAVCEGYARLFEALARAAGFDVVTIHGHGKDADYRIGDDASKANHTWNAVKIDGRWQLLDVTWAAGVVSKDTWTRRFDDYYFLTPPDQFINDHFPDDPQWQLLREPLSRDQYSRLVRLHPTFYRVGLQLASHREGRIAAAREVTIRFTGPDDLVLTAAVKGEDDPHSDFSWTFCQQQGRTYRVLVRWPRAGQYELTIFAKRRRDPGLPWSAVTYLIDARDGVGPAGAFPRTYQALDDLGLKPYSHWAGRFPAQNGVTITLTGPEGLQLWADLKGSDGANLGRQWTLCQRQDGVYHVFVRWPEPGSYTLVIYAGLQQAAAPFPTVVVYHIDAVGSGVIFPKVYNEFAQFGATLRTPLTGLLRAGSPATFSLHVPDAAEVAVAQDGLWRPLQKSGSDFTGQVTPRAGQLTIVADGHGIATYQAQ